MQRTEFVAVDPRTGRHIREATAEEREAYLAQPCRAPAFRKAIRAGDVLIDEWTGYGVNYGHLPLMG